MNEQNKLFADTQHTHSSKWADYPTNQTTALSWQGVPTNAEATQFTPDTA